MLTVGIIRNKRLRATVIYWNIEKFIDEKSIKYQVLKAVKLFKKEPKKLY